MKQELSPGTVAALLVAVAVVLGVLIYFAFFRQGPAPDITKIKGKPPPGWHLPTGRQGPGQPGAAPSTGVQDQSK